MTKSLAFAAILLLVASSPVWAGEDSSTIKTGVKTIISETVSAGKNVVSGVVEGVDEGRKGADSTDKADIVSSKADFERLLSADVRKVEELGPGQYEVTVALHNKNSFPVRVTNLVDVRSVVLLDKDGFSYPLPDPVVQGQDITALANSATRARFKFSNVEETPGGFRLFDVDLKMP